MKRKNRCLKKAEKYTGKVKSSSSTANNRLHDFVKIYVNSNSVLDEELSNITPVSFTTNKSPKIGNEPSIESTRRRIFRPSWIEKYSWLIAKDKRAFCKFCNQTLTNNLSLLQRHNDSKRHKDVMNSVKNQTFVEIYDELLDDETSMSSPLPNIGKQQPSFDSSRRRFLSSWSLKYHWLISKDKRAFCKFCKQALTNNLSLLRRHNNSKRHKKIMNYIKDQKLGDYDELMEDETNFTIKEEMQKMCRCCMNYSKSENDFHDMQLLFKADNSNDLITIAEMFSQSTKIMLQFDDGLPQQICSICFKELQDSFVFQQKCTKADDKLRKLLYVKNEEIEDETVKNIFSDEQSVVSDIENENVIEKSDPKISRNVKHQCNICKKIFDRQYRLKRHLISHDKKDENLENMNFECETCKCLFTSEEKLKRHKLIHNKSNFFGQHGLLLLRPKKVNLNSTRNIKIHETFENEPQNDESSIQTDVLFVKSQSNLIPFSDILNKDCTIDSNMILDEDQQSLRSCENKEKIYEGELMEDLNKETTIVVENVTQLDYIIEKPNPFNKRKAIHKCTVCEKVFDRQHRLKRHIGVHNTAKPYECDTCKHRYYNENTLERHKMLHTHHMLTLEPQSCPDFYQCPGCPRKFEKKQSLASHMRTHKTDNPDDKSFRCDFCEKSFAKYNALTRHLYTHDENKVFKCNLCEKAFALKGQLSAHIDWHKGVKPYICEYCNKGFQKACTLKIHLRIHTGETSYLCSECGKKFVTNNNLRQHIERHKGFKPFQCNECPSKFTCRGDLKSHMVTHTKIRPHSCDICGTSFTKRFSLKKHKRMHTGEKPYSCNACSMKFTSSSHLKRHMRTHTGEKPYTCKFCPRSFVQSNDLIKHLRSHVGEKVYQCEQCEMSFRLHSELRSHIHEHFRSEQKNKEQQQQQHQQQIQIDENLLQTHYNFAIDDSQ